MCGDECKMNDEPESSSFTCLSPDPHEHNIKDHILHFLGCVEIFERNEFLNIRSNLSPSEEVWKADCLSELRRIAFLRSKLEEDKTEEHLVQNIKESRMAWQASTVYKSGIQEVKEWRNSPESPTRENSELEVQAKRDYEPGRDVNTPFMLFKKQENSTAIYEHDDESVDPKNAIWGKFPNQKTNVQRLLLDEEGMEHGKRNLLHRRHNEGTDKEGKTYERIRYFHIPSNNMTWAEQAVSRYYGEERPDFHPKQRGKKKEKMTEAAWILKESHWRGQLHGGRATVSSRYMRPFCESIRSLNDAPRSPAPDKDDAPRSSAVDTAAQNIVLFMPYMHWETSRNQQRFSRIIERISDTKKKNDRQTATVARKLRQAKRNKLTKPELPAPSDSRSRWDRLRGRFVDSKGKSAMNPDDGAVSGTDEDALPQGPVSEDGSPQQPVSEDGSPQRPVSEEGLPQRQSGPIRSMTGLLKAHEVRKQLNLSGRYPKVDEHGRVDLDSWQKEQKRSQKRRSWFQSPKKEDLKPQYKLGQYLLDAALLFEAMTSYRDRKLLETYLMKDPPMHPRRTLDQSYYWSLNNTNHRDLDQVVYRATTADPLKFHRWDVDRSIWTGHDSKVNKTPEKSKDRDTEPCSECTANIQKVSRVIMVDQLWMWVLDSKTIITCFPKRYGANKHDTSGVHKSIRMRIDEGGIRIRSVFDLALVIFEECSNTFFDRTRTADKQPQVLDEFSEAIGNIMHQQTGAFEKLWRWTERASKMYRRPPGGGMLSELHIPLLDINPEGKLEKEIKDIVEELGIMTYIKKAEKDVLQSFVDNARRILNPEDAVESPSVARLDDYSSHQKGFIGHSRTASAATVPKSHPSSSKADTVAYQWFCNNAFELLRRVDQRIAQLEELERSAKSAAEMVKDLLELKQQQAGVVQAWQSVEYSNEAMRQGRSILVFTIVTIVFLPLSFMSSVFGMNTIEFGGSDNVMNLRDQFTYIFSISAGVIILTLLFSISASFRTFLWCISKQLYTTLLVWSGLYRHVYLRMNFTTDDLYENAMKQTENLKAKEKEKFLTSRRIRRDHKENKEQAPADSNQDVSDKNGNARGRWPLSLFRKRSMHGSANGHHQDGSV